MSFSFVSAVLTLLAAAGPLPPLPPAPAPEPATTEEPLDVPPPSMTPAPTPAPPPPVAPLPPPPPPPPPPEAPANAAVGAPSPQVAGVAAASASARAAAVARPRFDVAIGMGMALETAGFAGDRTEPVPAFQAMIGIGDGTLGLVTRMLAVGAAGRFHGSDTPVDRLAVDVLLALRPFARSAAGADWPSRMQRSVTFLVGPAVETVLGSARSDRRLGAVVGFHADLPVVLLQGQAGEADLRIRIGVRRMFGQKAQVRDVAVEDTGGEVFGSLAVVF
jgi:hypothetical protein